MFVWISLKFTFFFFFTLILEGIFFCVNILDCLSFSFSTLKISFLCLLLFIVSIDKSAICLTVALQKIICLPHFPFFLKIFIFVLSFSSFLMIFFSIVFFIFSLHGVYKTSEIDGSISLLFFGNLYCFLPFFPFLLSFWVSNYIHVRLPYWTLMYVTLFSVFSFFCLYMLFWIFVVFLDIIPYHLVCV